MDTTAMWNPSVIICRVWMHLWLQSHTRNGKRLYLIDLTVGQRSGVFWSARTGTWTLPWRILKEQNVDTCIIAVAAHEQNCIGIWDCIRIQALAMELGRIMVWLPCWRRYSTSWWSDESYWKQRLHICTFEVMEWRWEYYPWGRNVRQCPVRQSKRMFTIVDVKVAKCQNDLKEVIVNKAKPRIFVDAD